MEQLSNLSGYVISIPAFREEGDKGLPYCAMEQLSFQSPPSVRKATPLGGPHLLLL